MSAKPLGEKHTVRIPFPADQMAPQEFELAAAAREEGARIRGKGFDHRIEPTLSPDYKIASMTFSIYGMADAPTQRWICEVSVRGHMKIEVDAVSEEEAEDIAYDMAHETSYEADLEPEVDSVRPAPTPNVAISIPA